MLFGALLLPAAALAPTAPYLPWPVAISIAASELTSSLCVVVSSISCAEVLPALVPADRLASVSAGHRMFVIGVIPVAGVVGGAASSVVGLPAVLWAGGVLAGASALPIAASRLRHWVTPERPRNGMVTR